MDNRNFVVTYILKDDLGGITSLIRNLITCRGPEALPQEIIFLQIEGNKLSSLEGEFIKDISAKYFPFSKRNNFYHSFSLLQSEIGTKKGVIISNDMYDLLMLTHYNIERKVVQIVHDGYNVRLAIQFEAVVDCFICHSYFFFEMMLQLIPSRRQDIHFIPYGIPLINGVDKRMAGSRLKLLFLGRHDEAKGVHDLLRINNLLEQKGCEAEWIILGKGPESNKVKESWKDEKNVSFYSPATHEEVRAISNDCDILVFPTKFEGFPVAMVEAMSIGCVPVVSDLPGGIRELAADGNAILCTMDKNEEFADAIITLNNDRELLKQMSEKAMEYVHEHHNAKNQSPLFQELFKKIAYSEGQPRHHKIKQPLGSRLDQKWIPNFVTKFLRTFH